MRETPLAIPLYLKWGSPSDNEKGKAPSSGISFKPTHSASWSIDSLAGPSRQYLALAAPDNSIWIHALPSASAGAHLPPAIRTSPPPPLIERHVSGSGHGRPRAPSSASSILTSSSSRRTSRAKAFSPPPSAHPLPSTSLSPTIVTATAAASPADAHGPGHAGHSSLTERAELLDQLREQHKRRSDERNVGLGIANLGRNLPIHSHAEVTATATAAEGGGVAGSGTGTGGTTSPRSPSILSTHSDRTISSRVRGYFSPSNNLKDEGSLLEQEEELSERIQDVEVEMEIQEEKREKRNDAIVEEAMQSSQTAGIGTGSGSASPVTAGAEAGTPTSAGVRARRIQLRQGIRGRIVGFKIHEPAGGTPELYVLRDMGLLDIISLADLDVTSSVDLEGPEGIKALDVAGSSKDPLRLGPFWQWQDLHFVEHEQSTLIVVHAIPWPCGMPSHNGEVTRIVMLHTGAAPQHSELEVVARLELPGTGDVGVVRAQDHNGPFLLHAAETSLTSYPVTFPSNSPSPPLTRSQSPIVRTSATPSPRIMSSPYMGSSESATAGAQTQPLLRKNRSLLSIRETAEPHASARGLAKFIAARKADWRGGVGATKRKGEEADDGSAFGLGEGNEVERDGYGWTSFKVKSNGQGVGISSGAVDVFHCDGKVLKVKGTITLSAEVAVRRVLWGESWRSLCIESDKEILVYSGTSKSANEALRFTQISSNKLAKLLDLDDRDQLWSLSPARVQVEALKSGPESKPKSVLNLDIPPESTSRMIVPISPTEVFLADHKGTVAKLRLLDLLNERIPVSDEVSCDRLDSRVSCMKLVQHTKRYLVAGDIDGGVRIWNAQTSALLGSWTVFADAVQSVTLLDMPEAGRLKDHLLVTAQDGTIAIFSLTNMEHLFLIPGSRAPLRRVFVGGKDLMLAYANSKARVWNMESMEFRRSTGVDAAEEMLMLGKWAEVLFDSELSDTQMPFCAASDGSSCADQTLYLYPRALTAWINNDSSSSPSDSLDALRALLSLLLTFGVDEHIDEICTTKLGLVRPKQEVVFGRIGSHESACFTPACGVEAWQVSPVDTGSRQLMIISLLRPFLDVPEFERWSAVVIAFYAASLPQGIVVANLDYFAAFYMDPGSDIQYAARMLFASRLDQMTTEEVEDVVKTYQPYLPALRMPSEQNEDDAAGALLMLGGMALHKYPSMSTSALKAIADSILLYLQDQHNPHTLLAVELASKGFTTFQTFVDPMELLRRLFYLATHSNAPARLAVLQLASSNHALFLSTLSIDILDAKSAEGRNSIMKLCVYMARKKPQVLENGLTRIVEAVVKSLDPNVGKMRQDVWEAATVILNELVLAFSTVDFHPGTQRLALGTHEGAVIMYDLKTASRLYVLEPHTAPVSSVTFSPDGRRLITVSIDEGAVTVWKVGSSLSGFFNVGGPPRQGGIGGGGGAFKRIEFVRVDDDPLNSTGALSEVVVTWTGAKQVRVQIKETALTFET